MRTAVYILLVNSFFTHNGIEYADTTSLEDIILMPSIDAAFDQLHQVQGKLNRSGFIISDSDAPDVGTGCVFWCRMENHEKRAVKLGVYRKFVMGHLEQLDQD